MMNPMQSAPMPMGQPQGGPQGFSAPAAGINLFKVQEQLKDMPQQAIMAYANGSNPDMVPPYIALGEMERRTRAAKNAQTGEAPQGTVKDNLENQIKQTAGIASLGNMRQQQMGQQQAQQAMNAPGAVPGGVPQPEPQPEAPVMMARGGLASVPISSRMTAYKDGGIVGYADGGPVFNQMSFAGTEPKDPDVDEEGNPRGRDDRAKILEYNARLSERQRQEQQVRNQPSGQQVERMEQFYKPRTPQGAVTPSGPMQSGEPVGKFDLSGGRLAGALAGVQNIKDPAERARAMQALQSQMAKAGIQMPTPQMAPQGALQMASQAGPMPAAQAGPMPAAQSGPMPAAQGAPQPGIAGLPQAGGSAMDMFREDRTANEAFIKRMNTPQAVSPEQQALIDRPVEQEYMTRLRELDAKRATADTQSRDDIQARRRMDLWQSLIAGGEGSRGRGLGGLMAGIGQSLGQSSAARMGEEADLRTGALDRQGLLEKAQYEMDNLQRAKAAGDRDRVQKSTLELQKLESQLRERQTATSGTLAGQEMAATSREEVAAAKRDADSTRAELLAIQRAASGDAARQMKMAELSLKAEQTIDAQVAKDIALQLQVRKDPTLKTTLVNDLTKKLFATAGLTMPETPGATSASNKTIDFTTIK